MLIDGEKQVYFVDRDNNIFAVENIGFPQRYESERYITVFWEQGRNSANSYEKSWICWNLLEFTIIFNFF